MQKIFYKLAGTVSALFSIVVYRSIITFRRGATISAMPVGSPSMMHTKHPSCMCRVCHVHDVMTHTVSSRNKGSKSVKSRFLWLKHGEKPTLVRMLPRAWLTDSIFEREQQRTQAGGQGGDGIGIGYCG